MNNSIKEALTSNKTESIIPAIRRLSFSGSLADLPELLGVLKKTKNSEVKKEGNSAACAIIKNNLLDNYNDLDKNVRDKLGMLLESLDPDIIKEISNDIYSNAATRRVRAVQILGLLRKNPGTKNILFQLLKNKDEKVRATAVQLLGDFINPEKDLESIMNVLRDSDTRVRANTIEALERLGNPRLLPVFKRFIKDPSNRVRGNVLKAIHSLGDTEIEEYLLEMIESNNLLMKASGLWTAGVTGKFTERIIDDAAYYLLSKNTMVRINARKMLKRCSSQRSKGYLKYLDILG